MRSVVVETNLGEEAEYRGKSYTRHARSRFVDRPKPTEPVLIRDRWSSLTVVARLRRFADVMRRTPHDPDTRPQRHRSCMPTPVREMFKDLPGEPMRIPVGKADHDMATHMCQQLVRLSQAERIVAWGIACRLSDRRVGRELRMSHPSAAKAKLKLLERFVREWNAADVPLELADLDEAAAIIHRNVD